MRCAYDYSLIQSLFFCFLSLFAVRAFLTSQKGVWRKISLIDSGKSIQISYIVIISPSAVRVNVEKRILQNFATCPTAVLVVIAGGVLRKSKPPLRRRLQ